MQIILNGQQKEFQGTISLKGIIEQFSKETKHVIAEVNGTIIKNSQWESRILAAGDTVELVNLVGGG